MRTRAERRKINTKKALRKRFITRNVYHLNEKDNHDIIVYSVNTVKNRKEKENNEYYGSLHQYSKNKIHCSDYCCGIKTNNRGRNKFYGQGSKNWKPSDKKKIISLLEQLEKEILNEEDL